jgi:hypothetical protein
MKDNGKTLTKLQLRRIKKKKNINNDLNRKRINILNNQPAMRQKKYQLKNFKNEVTTKMVVGRIKVDRIEGNMVRARID